MLTILSFTLFSLLNQVLLIPAQSDTPRNYQSDLSPCACDLTKNKCDISCCCDIDCLDTVYETTCPPAPGCTSDAFCPVTENSAIDGFYFPSPLVVFPLSFMRIDQYKHRVSAATTG
jgi:hypothetical protein